MVKKASLVLVRADANFEIGSGHVMRCAALGMRLMARGASIHFVCSGLPDPLADWLRDRGFGLTVLPAADITDWHADLASTCAVARQVGHVDLLIVDHYRLDQAWECGMRSHVQRILVIDDLADRDHDCDLLLDQNLHEDAQNRYKQHVPPGTRQFLGPRYALLRSEFDGHGLERTRDGSVKRLLVFFGGTDPGNQTIKVIDALGALSSRAPESIIVLGPAHPSRDEVHKSVVRLPGAQVLDTTDQMAMLIAQADLAIGTCGVAAWERCTLGLPCLVVVTAENQREDAEILHRQGAVELLGDANGVGAEEWQGALRKALDDPHRIRAMALAAQKVMLGRLEALAELEKVLDDGMH
jgi:UDP-2,4-diacetamido-2,4,6-trideoxy-beta-L-altropyranose hydrolase